MFSMFGIFGSFTTACLLGAVDVDYKTLTIVAFAVAGALGGVVIFRQKKDLTHHREILLDMSQLLAKLGFSILPHIMRSIAIGDLTGAIHQAKMARDIFLDPVKAAAETDTLVKSMLTAGLADQNRRQALIDWFEKAVANSAQSAPAAPASSKVA